MAYADGSYRIRANWVTTDLLTAAYALTAFPKQTGQGKARWMIPLDSTMFNQAGSVEKSLSLDGKYVGLRNFSWALGGLLPCMAKYWQVDLFNNAPTARFTVMTWDPTLEAWPILWVIGTWGIAQDVAERGWRQGYRRYRVDFDVISDASEPEA